MTQEDDPQEQVQAIRSVNKGVPPNSIPPATLDEIYHVETQLDPNTQKEVIFWDDIVQAFDNAVYARYGTKIVPFLKGGDRKILEPRMIAAVPDIVLDVVVDTPVTNNVGVASPQVRQLELQPVPPQDGSMIEVEIASQDAISTSNATSTPITAAATSAPNSTSSSSAPSTATSAVRRNPVYGLEETAMENYNHIDKPLAFPSARGPQAVLDDRSPAVKDLPAPSHPNSDNEAQQRAPQSATTNLSVEMQLLQAVIGANHREKNALVTLGDMYRDGKGVPQDYRAAMDWYLKAVVQGDAAGQQRVGALYDKGFGVSQNYSTALDWYLKSAEQGYAFAQHSIGVLYHFGRGVPQDYAQAMEWYLKAADQGHAGSQYCIGEFYYYGRDVPKDRAQAMDWYLKAANQGFASAQVRIGVLYRLGRGVPQDYTQALNWFHKAADQGDASAQINLGNLYKNGEGVMQDYTYAVSWFQMAAEQGDATAKRALKDLIEEHAATWIELEHSPY